MQRNAVTPGLLPAIGCEPGLDYKIKLLCGRKRILLAAKPGDTLADDDEPWNIWQALAGGDCEKDDVNALAW